MEKHRTKYTNIDWSKHELVVEELDEVLIHHLKNMDK